MNELIRKCERESHIDVYGLGLDRVKWEAALEKFAKLIAQECADIADQAEPYKATDLILKHFGVEQ
jgi:hypothetical protein